MQNLTCRWCKLKAKNACTATKHCSKCPAKATIQRRKQQLNERRKKKQAYSHLNQLNDSDDSGLVAANLPSGLEADDVLRWDESPQVIFVDQVDSSETDDTAAYLEEIDRTGIKVSDQSNLVSRHHYDSVDSYDKLTFM